MYIYYCIIIYIYILSWPTAVEDDLKVHVLKAITPR